MGKDTERAGSVIYCPEQNAVTTSQTTISFGIRGTLCVLVIAVAVKNTVATTSKHAGGHGLIKKRIPFCPKLFNLYKQFLWYMSEDVIIEGPQDIVICACSNGNDLTDCLCGDVNGNRFGWSEALLFDTVENGGYMIGGKDKKGPLLLKLIKELNQRDNEMLDVRIGKSKFQFKEKSYDDLKHLPGIKPGTRIILKYKRDAYEAYSPVLVERALQNDPTVFDYIKED